MVNAAIAVSPAGFCRQLTVGSPLPHDRDGERRQRRSVYLQRHHRRLPDGLTLDPATGLLSGTPTTAGSYGFTVTATAAGWLTRELKAYSGVVNAAIALEPASLPSLTGQQPVQCGGVGEWRQRRSVYLQRHRRGVAVRADARFDDRPAQRCSDGVGIVRLHGDGDRRRR